MTVTKKTLDEQVAAAEAAADTLRRKIDERDRLRNIAAQTALAAAIRAYDSDNALAAEIEALVVQMNTASTNPVLDYGELFSLFVQIKERSAERTARRRVVAAIRDGIDPRIEPGQAASYRSWGDGVFDPHGDATWDDTIARIIQRRTAAGSQRGEAGAHAHFNDIQDQAADAWDAANPA